RHRTRSFVEPHTPSSGIRRLGFRAAVSACTSAAVLSGATPWAVCYPRASRAVWKGEPHGALHKSTTLPDALSPLLVRRIHFSCQPAPTCRRASWSRRVTLKDPGGSSPHEVTCGAARHLFTGASDSRERWTIL